MIAEVSLTDAKLVEIEATLSVWQLDYNLPPL